jgi:transposase InsO family protein
MLKAENSMALENWIFQDILCRWGALGEIVTDNGASFLKALAYLSKHYHINHIRISGYNSRVNGIVERPHFDVRQALFKVVDQEENKWS